MSRDIDIYLGLVHHPVLNKRGDEVTTSVTNLDIHDIARSCKTFGIKKYFIITPLVAQHEIVNRILGHWEKDTAAAYNPDRQNALELVTLVNSIEEAEVQIENESGTKSFLTVTGANLQDYDTEYRKTFSTMQVDNRGCFLVFGTGWGLSASVVERAECCLPPISGSSADGYNHLSVRSAVAIYCDRLRGCL